jgi:hypothetical protein
MQFGVFTAMLLKMRAFLDVTLSRPSQKTWSLVRKISTITYTLKRRRRRGGGSYGVNERTTLPHNSYDRLTFHKNIAQDYHRTGYAQCLSCLPRE